MGQDRDTGDTGPPSIEQTVDALDALLRLGPGDELDLDVKTRDRLAPLIDHPVIKESALAPGEAAAVLALDDIIDAQIDFIENYPEQAALRILFEHRQPNEDAPSSHYTLEGRGFRAAEEIGLGGWNSLKRRNRLSQLLSVLAYRIVGVIQANGPGTQAPALSSEELTRLKHRLNSTFSGFAKLHHLAPEIPLLTDGGSLDGLIGGSVRRFASEIAETLPRNDGVAFVQRAETADWSALDYRTADYATLRALVSNAPRDWISLGAYRVVTDHLNQALHLTLRSPNVDTWPSLLSTPGGLITTDSPTPPFDETIHHAMFRELREELGPYRSLESSEWFAVIEDVRIDRLQVVGMGGHAVFLPDQPTDYSEAEPTRIRLGDLESSLMEGHRWAPSARLQVLLWLGMGAPMTGQPIAPAEAKAIYQRVTDEIIESPDHASVAWRSGERQGE